IIPVVVVFETPPFCKPNVITLATIVNLLFSFIFILYSLTLNTGILNIRNSINKLIVLCTHKLLHIHKSLITKIMYTLVIITQPKKTIKQITSSYILLAMFRDYILHFFPF